MASWALVIQYLCGVATVLNLFMVLIIILYSHQHIGRYKWLMALYSSVVAGNSFVLFLTVPTEVIVDSSIVIYSYGGLITNVSFGPIIHYVFFQLWLSCILLLFAWRYIVLCKQYWAVRIRHSIKWKGLVCFIYLAYTSLIFFIGAGLGHQFELNQENRNEFWNRFGQIPGGYIGFRLTSYDGLIAISLHIFLVMVSVTMMIIFGRRIARRIQELRKGFSSSDATINQQIFVSLVLQMASSFLLCYLPSFVLLILPLIQSNVLDGVPPVSPLLNAVIRIIDPVIWILCVQEYRQSILLPMTSIVCCHSEFGSDEEPNCGCIQAF